jgi:hypothetical protein
MHRLILIILFILLIVSPVKAAVIFSDNFDSQADWVLPQHPECGYFGGSNTCGSATVPPTGWDGFYTETNCSAGNGIGNHNLYISSYADYPTNTVACRSGKCITQWDERCTSGMVNSDGNIHKDLGAEYTTLYFRYYFRFASNYPMTMNKKLYHMQHYSSGSPWQYFGTNYGNQPGGVVNWNTYNGFLEPSATFRGYCGPENETSANPPYYSCYSFDNGTPANVFLDGGQYGDESGLIAYDIEGAYQDYRTMTGSAQTLLRDGQWHRFEAMQQINTWNSGTGAFNADGIFRIWLDGTLVLGRSNVVWQKCYGGYCSEQRGWRVIGLGGNSNNDTVDSGENWYAIDDLCISDAYIGDAVCGASPSVPNLTGVTITGGTVQ